MLVSVIIPTFNRAGPVQRAIDSVLRQSYKNFELLVVDDGSTDDTAFWLSKIQDPRFRYMQSTNLGVSHARNLGVKNAKADWICFLDSDDLWRRHKLSEQLRFHDKHRDILISQTEDMWLKNSSRLNKMKKHLTREGDIFKESLKLCLISPSSVMLHKPLFWECGGFDETLPACEDYDLWLKITAKHKIGFVKKTLVTKFGGHSDQLSKKYDAMDRFRLQSLQNLLKTQNLSPVQIDSIEEEIRRKSKIINKNKVAYY